MIPAGSVQFTGSTYNVTEGAAATITVSRTGGDNGAITVNCATSDGTATAGSDYTALSSVLSWSDADTADKTFVVTTRSDTLVEGIETVNLTLSAPANGASLGALSGATLRIADPPIDLWRLSKFGINSNDPSIAGDNADPNHDGIPNLVEYALSRDPLASDTRNLPSAALENGYLTLTVSRSSPPSDVILSAEVSGTLPGDWQADTTPLIDSPTLFKARDNVPITNAPRRFIHLRVTRP